MLLSFTIIRQAVFGSLCGVGIGMKRGVVVTSLICLKVHGPSTQTTISIDSLVTHSAPVILKLDSHTRCLLLSSRLFKSLFFISSPLTNEVVKANGDASRI